MKNILFIIVISLFQKNLYSQKLERTYEQQQVFFEMQKEYSNAGINYYPILKKKLKKGSPIEKEAVLNVIKNNNLQIFIPYIVKSITDTTSLPSDWDTGWGFVGHQAASTMAHIAYFIDRVTLEERGYNDYSFFNDAYMGGSSLQSNGRLKEVSLNWKKWFSKYKKNKNKKSQ